MLKSIDWRASTRCSQRAETRPKRRFDDVELLRMHDTGPFVVALPVDRRISLNLYLLFKTS